MSSQAKNASSAKESNRHMYARGYHRRRALKAATRYRSLCGSTDGSPPDPLILRASTTFTMDSNVCRRSRRSALAQASQNVDKSKARERLAEGKAFVLRIEVGTGSGAGEKARPTIGSSVRTPFATSCASRDIVLSASRFKAGAIPGATDGHP